MKVAFHESDCCFNWSPEPRTPLPRLPFGSALFSPLIFFLLSCEGAWILSPSAAKACPLLPALATGQALFITSQTFQTFSKLTGEQMMLWLQEQMDANAICDPQAKP